MEQITIEMRIIKVKPKREIRKGGGGDKAGKEGGEGEVNVCSLSESDPK